MLSKEERKERNQQFWEGFRKEMRSVKGAGGRSIDWINYPTKVKDIYVRLEVDSKGARVCFDIQPKDDGIRSLLWEQMVELKVVMQSETGEATAWNEFNHEVSGRTVSRIYWEKESVNFYNYDDHPTIKEFLRDQLRKFDAFYHEYEEIIISLAD